MSLSACWRWPDTSSPSGLQRGSWGATAHAAPASAVLADPRHGSALTQRELARRCGGAPSTSQLYVHATPARTGGSSGAVTTPTPSCPPGAVRTAGTVTSGRRRRRPTGTSSRCSTTWPPRTRRLVPELPPADATRFQDTADHPPAVRGHPLYRSRVCRARTLVSAHVHPPPGASARLSGVSHRLQCSIRPSCVALGEFVDRRIRRQTVFPPLRRICSTPSGCARRTQPGC